MASVPPRSNIGAFEQIHQIYYGTDDGFARLTPLEEKQHDAAHIAGLYEIFARYQEFASGVAPNADRISIWPVWLEDSMD